MVLWDWKGVYMTNVFDVAIYILKQVGSISAMKLQKLIYYCQAWSLVWDDEHLFPEPIEAWTIGPVVRNLYDAHKGLFKVFCTDFEKYASSELTSNQKETIDTVLRTYGTKSSGWLNDQVHIEDPWRDARMGIDETERGNKEITHTALAEYYGSLC
jgi:uncharacterized phage-associated protein